MNSQYANCDLINVGTGIGYSNLDLVRIVEDTLGKKINVKFAPRRSGDAVALTSDVEKMRSKLPLGAPFVHFAESVKSAYKWRKIKNVS